VTQAATPFLYPLLVPIQSQLRARQFSGRPELWEDRPK
jgi:hypothetical protein